MENKLPSGVFYHEKMDWAERFFFDGPDAELKAYKLAYAYRNSQFGVEVKASGNNWIVNVLTEIGKTMRQHDIK